MQEIKFRGKTLSGKWVYGDLVHITNTKGVKGCLIITEHQATAESTNYDCALCYAANEFKVVDPNTVGQFTGVLDGFGRKIYEGDIVYIAGWGNTEIDFPFTDLYEATANTDYGSSIGAIMGNIYDNHELLDGDGGFD